MASGLIHRSSLSLASVSFFVPSIAREGVDAQQSGKDAQPPSNVVAAVMPLLSAVRLTRRPFAATDGREVGPFLARSWPDFVPILDYHRLFFPDLSVPCEIQ